MRFLKRNKRALKHTFLVSIHELMIEGTSKWQPSKLSVTLSRRKRQVSTEPKSWEPTLRNPYRGIIIWSQPANLEFSVTLYQNSSSAFEKKDLYIAIKDHTAKGRDAKICTAMIDLSLHVLTKQTFIEKLPLVCSKKAVDGSITFTIKCLDSDKACPIEIARRPQKVPPPDNTAKSIESTEKQESVDGILTDIPLQPPDVIENDENIKEQSTNISSDKVSTPINELTQDENTNDVEATEDNHQISSKSQIESAQQPKTPTTTPDVPSSLVRLTHTTRSARMRKFKFYQFRRIHEDSDAKEKFFKDENAYRSRSPSPDSSKSDSIHFQSVLEPRESVIKGKVTMKSGSCVVDQLQNLEQELKSVEKEADSIKSQLSINVKQNQNQDPSQEAHQKELLEKWCALVNQKNDLIRRQMQLNILEKEESLEKTFEQLDKEVRSLMAVDESRKTEAQKEREKYLLDELVTLVNRRDELVNHLHVQEEAIEDDNALKEGLRSMSLGNTIDDQNCCIQ